MSIIRKFVLSLQLIIPFTVIYAQAPDSVWSKTIDYGGHEYFTSIEKVSDGGFILAAFNEPLDGVTSNSYLLVRLDNNGDTLWVKSFLKSGGDGQAAFETLDGGFILMGEGDPWMIKTDSDGILQWQQPKLTVADGLMLHGSAITSDSGFVATGSLENEGMHSTIIVKTDKTGTVEWTKTYRGENDMVGISIVETSTGGYAIAGAKGHPTGGGNNHGMLFMISGTGDSSWTAVYGGDNNANFQTIQETADGGFIMAGRNKLSGGDDMPSDIYVVKSNSLGVIDWEKVFGGPGDQEAMGVIQTADLGYSLAIMGVADTSNPQSDAWVTHFAANGDSAWTIHLGGEYEQYSFDLAETSDGEYLVAGGYITSWETGHFDMYLLKLGTVQTASIGGVSTLPDQFILYANYPNPFNPSTMIGLDLSYEASIELTIYDILGRDVRELWHGKMDRGHQEIYWNGRNNIGESVPTGMYFARLVAPGYSKTIKMLLLK